MIFLIIPVAVVGIVILIVVGAVVAGLVSRRRMLRLPPAEREAALREAQRKYDERRFGQINGHLICPHCSATGHVRTKPMTKKAGISGGKYQLSILAIGAKSNGKCTHNKPPVALEQLIQASGPVRL